VAHEEVAVGRFHHEHAVVAPHDGVEEHRALPREAQLVSREEARALVIDAVLPGAGARHVPEAVEEGEGVAMLQHAPRVAGARGGGEHIPLVADADRFLERDRILHALALRGRLVLAPRARSRRYTST